MIFVFTMIHSLSHVMSRISTILEYHNGLGVTKNESKAIEYFQWGIENIYIKAIFNLICCYTHGKDAQPNCFKVIELISQMTLAKKTVSLGLGNL